MRRISAGLLLLAACGGASPPPAPVCAPAGSWRLEFKAAAPASQPACPSSSAYTGDVSSVWLPASGVYQVATGEDGTVRATPLSGGVPDATRALVGTLVAGCAATVGRQDGSAWSVYYDNDPSDPCPGGHADVVVTFTFSVGFEGSRATGTGTTAATTSSQGCPSPALQSFLDGFPCSAGFDVAGERLPDPA